MNMRDRLLADLREAMRAHDGPRKDASRMARAAVKNAEIEWQREANDEDVVKLVAAEIKRRREAIELFRKGNRLDLVANEQAQLVHLTPYLPEQLSSEQVAQIVEKVVEELGASGPGDLGAVMRQSMAQVKGQADGRLVSTVAREILGRKSTGAT